MIMCIEFRLTTLQNQIERKPENRTKIAIKNVDTLSLSLPI